MGTRIFVSHSTALPDLATDVDPVYDALTHVGFDVLLDRKRLETGSWIQQLYAWIGLCQGAVVLLSKRAGEKERFWVAREASLLMWRKALDPGFAVIPVLRDGASPDDFNKGNFADLGLVGEQGPDTDTPEAIIEFIRTRSSLSSDPVAKTPLEAVAEKIAAKLSGLDQETLRARAEEMNIDLGPWDPKRSEYLRFAIRLLQLPYLTAIGKLQGLADFAKESEKPSLSSCRDLLCPLHANPEAATILPCLYESANRLAAALNAKAAATAELYIRRAYWECATKSLHFAQPNLEVGENVEEAVTRQVIQESLAKLFPGYEGALSREEFRGLLEQADGAGQRLFLLWDCAKNVPPRIFKKVQSDLPLRFFLLAGAAQAPVWLRQLEASCYRELAPGLKADEERTIAAQTALAKTMV